MLKTLAPIKRQRQIEVIRELDETGTVGRNYLLLTLLSCIIATLGLLENSAAVIIGAMLIAPLLAPITRSSIALVRGDLKRLWRALSTLLSGVLLALAVSGMLGLLASLTFFNAFEQLPTEILNRTTPNLFDLIVALAGGAAGAYALAQPNISAALPGVAIATALMPPVCTVGIGVALGRLDLSLGALLLFLANLAGILFASSLVFVLVGFRPRVGPEGQEFVIRRALLIEGVMLLLVIVPLILLMVSIVENAQTNRVIRDTLVTELAQIGNGSLVSFEVDPEPTYLQIVATVRVPRDLTLAEAKQIERALAIHLNRPVALKLVEIPVTILDPLNPPTPTPTPSPTPTPTPTPTPSPTPTPTPTLPVASP